MGTHAFNHALGVGWCEILSWYLVEWARFMETVVVGSEAQQGLPETRVQEAQVDIGIQVGLPTIYLRCRMTVVGI